MSATETFPCGSTAIPAAQIPYRLPGIDKIREDPGIFRVGFTRDEFLEADYPNVYGLSMLRTGGDNIDLLSMKYFNHFSERLLSSSNLRLGSTPSSALDAHFRLSGLGIPPGR